VGNQDRTVFQPRPDCPLSGRRTGRNLQQEVNLTPAVGFRVAGSNVMPDGMFDADQVSVSPLAVRYPAGARP
jgi:hypothetical protein